MSRRVFLTTLLAGAILGGADAVPARPAVEPCICRIWAINFALYPPAQRAYDEKLQAMPLRPGAFRIKDRRRVKHRVYDYAREGDFEERYCNKRPKICRAALACVIAGGSTYAAARQAGQGKGAATRAGAIACAGAAATVMIA
jgi:hypothetical protein